MLNNLRSVYVKLPIISENRWFTKLFKPHMTAPGLQRMAAIAEDEYTSKLLNCERAREAKRLISHHFQVYSQNGEDGMIAEIFRRIGTTNKQFVEVGAGNGLENNTAYLLLQGWKGLWVEADESSNDQMKKTFEKPIANDSLRLRQHFVSAQNIGQILKDAHSPEPDLFSLDIDYNTYWVWQAIDQFKPRVIVVEYNASFPPDLDWKVIYDKDRVWDGTNYFGASLKAYELLGKEKRYTLVGCDLSGSNAFFVRSDLAGDHFMPDTSSETQYQPLRTYLLNRQGHPPSIIF